VRGIAKTLRTVRGFADFLSGGKGMLHDRNFICNIKSLKHNLHRGFRRKLRLLLFVSQVSLLPSSLWSINIS
jgi:hypothetical protein